MYLCDIGGLSVYNTCHYYILLRRFKTSFIIYLYILRRKYMQIGMRSSDTTD